MTHVMSDASLLSTICFFLSFLLPLIPKFQMIMKIGGLDEFYHHMPHALTWFSHQMYLLSVQFYITVVINLSLCTTWVVKVLFDSNTWLFHHLFPCWIIALRWLGEGKKKNKKENKVIYIFEVFLRTRNLFADFFAILEENFTLGAPDLL